MKNYFNYISVAFLTLLIGCKEEVEKPKVRYENNSKEKAVAKVDTTQISVADLPINFQGTNFLIHPVGDLNSFGRTKNASYDASRSDSEQSFTVSNYNEYEITGYLKNLKFQEVGSDSIRPLSTKPILIETATYLKTIADKSKKQLIIYTLSDSDTNQDGKIDGNDIKTLYLSESSGANFIKISDDFQEVIDWNLVESINRLYFREIEDSNKNGAFDKSDKIHYHYLDLLSKELKTVEYNPID